MAIITASTVLQFTPSSSGGGGIREFDPVVIGVGTTRLVVSGRDGETPKIWVGSGRDGETPKIWGGSGRDGETPNIWGGSGRDGEIGYDTVERLIDDRIIKYNETSFDGYDIVKDAKIKEIRNILSTLNDPQSTAYWTEKLKEEESKSELRSYYDEQIENLIKSGADKETIEAVEDELKTQLSIPQNIQKMSKGNYSISISVSRSLSCVMGFMRLQPTKKPDIESVYVIESGLITIEVSSPDEPKVSFYGDGFVGSAYIGASTDNSGNKVWRHTVIYKYNKKDFVLNGPGTDLQLVARAGSFVTVVAQGSRGVARIHTERQLDIKDVTMPTAIKSKVEVYTKYKIFRTYPSWDSGKSGPDYYDEAKPLKIVYRVELVFVNPNTGKEAGNAGFEYRVEQFNVNPPEVNHTEMPDVEVGEDPTLDGSLWV
ncbi:MAG: hypothetical protein HQM00_05750 [Magnetococcales bacterium]|nr:hypothetical protein [Magnetococcales bacterium]